MSLNYDKIKSSQGDDSQWSSYSDLFMVLSMVFLLLYVTSSLRSGTYSLQKNLQFQELQAEREALKKEQAVYETLKDDYLEAHATAAEADTYKELMDKLVLLQEDAKDEKEELREKARENENKEKALNKYQQIIRNIINANVLAKSGIKDRDIKLERKRQKIAQNESTIKNQTDQIKAKDQLIKEKEQTIQDKQEQIEQSEDIIADKKRVLREKNQELDELSRVIVEKKKVIKTNNVKIAKINKNLDRKIKSLKKSQQKRKISRAKMKKKIKQLKSSSAKKIQGLESKNTSMTDQLASASTSLKDVNKQLESATRVIEDQETEKKGLTDELAQATDNFGAEIKAMQANFASEMKNKKSAFESALASEKSSGAAKAKKMADFEAAIKEEKASLEKRVAVLAEKASESQKKLENAKNDNSKFKDYIKTLEVQSDELKTDLASAKKLARARRQLAKSIKNNFRKAGVKVKIDPKTGDVQLSFGDEYFDTGKFFLKKKMEKILRRFMPIYAKSLFKDKNIAKKIASVEIIGFASPTYRGKYIDPKSLASGDRVAVNYNLDLSYNRAREIFRYIFNKEKITYRYQSNLLPKVKVTGRSFLANGIEGRTVKKGLSVKKYCKKYNCKKEQRVIIKFNLAD